MVTKFLFWRGGLGTRGAQTQTKLKLILWSLDTFLIFPFYLLFLGSRSTPIPKYIFAITMPMFLNEIRVVQFNLQGGCLYFCFGGNCQLGCSIRFIASSFSILSNPLASVQFTEKWVKSCNLWINGFYQFCGLYFVSSCYCFHFSLSKYLSISIVIFHFEGFYCVIGFRGC